MPLRRPAGRERHGRQQAAPPRGNIQVMSRRSERRAYAAEMGPCYDYCACSTCWRGWTGIPFLTRLWWRATYIMGTWPE